MAEKTVSSLLGGLAESFSPRIAQRNQNERRIALEEKRFAENQKTADHNKLLKQVEIYRTMKTEVQKSIEGGLTEPDQGNAAIGAIDLKLQDLFGRMGMDFHQIETNVQPEPVEGRNDFETAQIRMAEIDDAKRQIEREGGDINELIRLEKEGLELQGVINKASKRKVNRRLIDVNGEQVLINDETGDPIASYAAKGRTAKGPDVRTVRGRDDAGKVVTKQFDVSTPGGLEAFRDVIHDGWLEVTKPSSNSKKSRLSIGNDGQVIVEESSGTDLFGTDRGQGERNRLAAPLNAMEGALLQLLSLEKMLQPEQVGIRGAVQEQFLNRFIAPFAEAVGIPIDGLVETDFVQSRRLMELVGERLMRITQDNPDRFSNEDVNRLTKILVKPNPRITYKEYKDTLSTVIQFFQDKRLMNSQQLGRRTVLDMTPNEIYAAVKSKRMSQLLATRVLSARFTKEELEQAKKERMMDAYNAGGLPPPADLNQPQRPE